MLKSLLPYTADIKRVVVLNSNWEDYKSYSTIYSSIPCRYYSTNKRLDNTNLATETNLNKIKVIISPENNNIAEWDEISIFDTTLWEIWTYLISSVKAQRLFSQINHIALEITEL
jgi:hypothetical protein